jgi:hypothetical protein
MGTITIQVDAEVAKAYQEINSTNRKRNIPHANHG